jgi:hypothetical protein
MQRVPDENWPKHARNLIPPLYGEGGGRSPSGGEIDPGIDLAG